MPTARLNRIALSALALSLGAGGITLTANTLSAAPVEKTAPPVSGDAMKRNAAAPLDRRPENRSCFEPAWVRGASRRCRRK